MRKKISMILAFLLLFESVQALSVCAADSNRASGSFYTHSALENWYKCNNSEEYKVDFSAINHNNTAVAGSEIDFIKGDILTFQVNVPSDGAYYLVCEYKPNGNVKAMDTLFNVICDENDMAICQLPILWSDSERYASDRFGNDATPEQNAVCEYIKSPMTDSADAAKDYYSWNLKAGEHSFSVTSTVQGIVIRAISLCMANRSKKYSDKKKIADNVSAVTIEGESYSLKSDSYIRGAAVKSADRIPYDTYHNKINVLDGSTWNSAGQKILWEFDVKTDGWYRLGMICRQNDNTNKKVFRRIEIDGDVPFSEWQSAGIPYTGTTGYRSVTMKAGDSDALVHLEKGHHTVAMTAVLGDYSPIYDEIYTLMDDINKLGLNLLKITAGISDANRTWDMSVFMPDAADNLVSFADRIDEIYKKLQSVDGVKPFYANDLIYASEQLRKLAKTPETIPNKSSEICRGDSSATKYLGNVLSVLTAQGVSVDRIYFYGSGNMPVKSISIFEKLINSVKRFFQSFFSKEMSGLNDSESNDEIKVWISQSSQVVSLLQQMIDEQYNKRNGKDIKLSIMPSEQKLVLANAAGTNPDVVLSTSAGSVFTFAVRGALKNMLDYDDFLTYYNKDYQLESLVSTSYGDGVYGAVDSRNFQLLFYRKDILDMLGQKVPDTWDDVRAMMPTLLRNQMNFYITLSSSSAMKGLGVTSPFVYQNGGEIYSDDGTKTALDTKNSINAITEMTEFYKVYGMQTTVASFYNSFRYGEVPIGMGDFNTYLQLKVAAPEIVGKWDAALTPGTRQNNGKVLRYQPANNTACMIFKNTSKPDEAWRFLKWWLSSEVQLEYSMRRIVNFGAEYQWNTANISAFSQLPIDSKIRDLVLEQWKYQREVTPHPASYIVERELSGVWNGVVINNEEMIESLDEAVTASNREIRRKLEEFGYIDSDGKLICDYNTKTLDMLRSKLKEAEAH